MHPSDSRLSVEVTYGAVGHDELVERHIDRFYPFSQRFSDVVLFDIGFKLDLFLVMSLFIVVAQEVLGELDVLAVTLLVELPQVLAMAKLVGPKMLQSICTLGLDKQFS
jgi:hypothetical protein